MTLRAVRELAVVLAFSALGVAAVSGKAYHIDEPLFLAPARHILSDPWHPLGFDYNWYGETVPMAEINNTPPLTLYLLALALKVTGGGERVLRLFLLPFDLAAAGALYLLAARFLARPLLPTLILLAGPAYFINMSQLYPDKFCMAAGLWGLYRTVKACDEGMPGLWAPAALIGLSVLFKYAGIVFIVPAAWYAFHQGAAPRRLAALIAGSLAPLGMYLGWDFARGAGAWNSAWHVIGLSAADSWPDWAHKLRSFFSFAGGCLAAAAVWPFLVRGGVESFGGRTRWAAVAAASCLFWPGFDIEPVRGLDRILGVGFTLCALAALALFLMKSARKSPGWSLWAGWAASAACLQLFVYWAIIARITAFLLPPCVFFLAARLENSLSERSLRRIYAVSLLLTAALTACLAWVDHVHAGAQNDFARLIAAPYVSQGRRVFHEGHWGLQHYMELAGAVQIDHRAKGWEALAAGDIVAASRVNSNTNLSRPSGLSRDHVIRRDFSVTVRSRVPLRLMSGWSGQGGFYANSWGFLPYSFSLEPVDEFQVGEHQ